MVAIILPLHHRVNNNNNNKENTKTSSSSSSMPKKKRQREEEEKDEEDIEENPAQVGDDDSEDVSEADSVDASEEEEEEEDVEEEKAAAAAAGGTTAAPSSSASPFMDAFYSLAATDPRERAAAAQTILHHILVTSPATSGDGPYAWKRLLRGLGSGRAAARQGNASALSALIKMALVGGMSNESGTKQVDKNDHDFFAQLQKHCSKQQEHNKNPNKDTSDEGDDEAAAMNYIFYEDMAPIDFIRQQLLAATEPPTGRKKKKGSDERDALFGRLFGIVAVIRSGILGMPLWTLEQIKAWIQDLCNLYRHDHNKKQWMREPAAHALCLLLSSLPQRTTAADLAAEVILPVLLTEGDNTAKVTAAAAAAGKNSAPTLLETLSAEQVALVLFIQNLAKDVSLLPVPWNEPLLSCTQKQHQQQHAPESWSVLAPILASTSHVTQPRTHLVWDVLALCLTTEESIETKGEDGAESSSKKVDERILKPSSMDVLDSIFHQIIEKQLLGAASSSKSTKEKVDEDDDDNGDAMVVEKPAHKATDDRRALALCVLRQWAGVEFISSITGRTILQVEVDVLETTILRPTIVKRLFGDLVSTKDHYLKPLAALVLQQVTEQAMASSERREAVVRSLLRASSRFDAQTKSATVSTLLGSNESSLEDVQVDTLEPVWDSVFDFCIDRICSLGGSSEITSYEAIGLVDLLFHHGKFLVRLAHVKDKEVPDSVISMVKRILGFFVSTAFLNCLKVTAKKKASAIVKLAARNKNIMLPYELRCVISSRYYSLLAEQVAADLHGAGLTTATKAVQGCLDDWNDLTKAGALPMGNFGDVDEESMKDASPDETLGRLQKLTKSISDAPNKGRESFLLAARFLSSLLYLHLYNCGYPDNKNMEDDDPDFDDSDDKDEVENFMRDIMDITERFEKFGKNAPDEEGDEDTNQLTDLASLCVNILSSPLASGSHLRGASPKMLREAARQLWIQGLVTASQAGIKADPDLLVMLLDALGAKAEETEVVSENSDGESSEDEAMDEDDDAGVFAKAASLDVGAEMEDESESQDGSQKDIQNDKEENVDEDDDIEVDHSKLQSLLQEDDDASLEADVLEHHAGADAALSRLIQIKQDARKAGQKAREKIELSNSVRCVVLLETLLMGKPDGWGSLVSPGFVLSSVVPLLDRRRYLERELTKISQKSQDTTAGEKRALLDRVTSLLKQRVLKTKISFLEWSPEAEPKELVQELSQILLKQARERNSKEHDSLVSSCLVFVTRSLVDYEDRINVADEIYSSAVKEWSSKKSSRLDVKLFEDLIHQAYPVSQSVLIKPLADAAFNGKSPFLKSESFRLLYLLFNPKLQHGTGDDAESGSSVMKDSIDDVLAAIAAALSDPEMKKAKRAKEVLKTLERLTEIMDDLKFKVGKSKIPIVEKALRSIGSDSESQGLKALSEKLLSKLEKIQTSHGKIEELEENSGAKKTKKSKKKKGKKKR